jgi:hypothetical protein
MADLDAATPASDTFRPEEAELSPALENDGFGTQAVSKVGDSQQLDSGQETRDAASHGDGSDASPLTAVLWQTLGDVPTADTLVRVRSMEKLTPLLQSAYSEAVVDTLVKRADFSGAKVTLWEAAVQFRANHHAKELAATADTLRQQHETAMAAAAVSHQQVRAENARLLAANAERLGVEVTDGEGGSRGGHIPLNFDPNRGGSGLFAGMLDFSSG